MNPETEPLTFCIYCGRKVAPYPFSTESYSDLNEYGKEAGDFVGKPGVASYRCECSPSELLAPNQFDTGTSCPNCRSFMNLFAQHCGVCSRQLRGPRP